MLQAIRNRAHGIFAWVMLIMIGVPFALWGIQNYLDTGKEQPMAVVGDRELFERDVNRAYEQSLSSLVGLGQFDEQELKREALERLVREELIALNADEKNMAISDDDVRAFIQSLPYFQTEGRFDKEKYKLMLSSQSMNPAQFVAQIRKALTLEQYQRGVSDSVFVTSQQLNEFYRLRNQQRQIEYVTVPLRKRDFPVDEQKIEAYYRDNVASFRNPERISIEYIGINVEDLAKGIEPSEEELKALYEEQKNQVTTAERRKVSHILVSVDSSKPESDKAAQEKVAALKQRLDKGEDFATLAKEASDDTVSATKGGDLGFITKEGMDPNFANAAFQLAKGEVSQPVKTSFGYHLIKVAEIDTPKTPSFQEMRPELVKSFQRSAAESKFYELGQILTEQGFEHPDTLEPAAKLLGLPIQHTGLFTRDRGEGVAAEDAVRKAAFSEDVLNGRNSEPVEIGNEKAYLLRLKDREPASDKPLNEVRQEIIDRIRIDAAREEARKQAEQLYEAAKNGKSLADLAAAMKLNVSNPGPLARNNDKLPAPLLSAVFKAPHPTEQNPTAGWVALENGDQLVFQLRSVQAVSGETTEPKELDMAREYLLKGLGQNQLAALLQQLRETGDVYVKAQP